jgi:hypothetical protein
VDEIIDAFAAANELCCLKKRFVGEMNVGVGSARQPGHDIIHQQACQNLFYLGVYN